MKKTYIKPQTLAYVIATQHQLLTVSTVGVSSDPYKEGTMTDLSRSIDFDDDEFFDE